VLRSFCFLIAGLCLAREPTFRADTNRVPVDVQVLDGTTRRPIIGLSQADFVITDNGTVSPPVAFDDRELSMDVVIAVDVSGSMTNDGPRACADALLHQLAQEDRVALVSFDRDVHVRAGLTNDWKLERSALVEIAMRDRNHDRMKNSRLYDAVQRAAGVFGDAPRTRRRALIVLTHNREHGSQATVPKDIDELLERYSSLEAITMREEVAHGGLKLAFGSMRPMGNSNSAKSADYLEDGHSIEPVAEAAGGMAQYVGENPGRSIAPTNGPDNSVSIDEAVGGLLERLRHQYTLYIRSAQPGQPQRRAITVKLSDEASAKYPGAIVRARSGYYTLATSGAASPK
jgi:VWFA-related protein